MVEAGVSSPEGPGRLGPGRVRAGPGVHGGVPAAELGGARGGGGRGLRGGRPATRPEALPAFGRRGARGGPQAQGCPEEGGPGGGAPADAVLQSRRGPALLRHLRPRQERLDREEGARERAVADLHGEPPDGPRHGRLHRGQRVGRSRLRRQRLHLVPGVPAPARRPGGAAAPREGGQACQCESACAPGLQACALLPSKMCSRCTCTRRVRASEGPPTI
mmetsp:Transcript_20767/g.55163  ORF Transcript_20767/g.55163 Transcript_20767/m.55163 type:complete len:219 (-) Transcript_20767:54-710(-)